MVRRATDGNRIGGAMITGTIDVSLTLEKVNYYNALEKRDEPLPVEEVKYMLHGVEHKYYKCPMCGEYIYDGYEFCSTCGQRLDMENFAV